ncbi:MAG: hypothetical protein WA432_03920 [Candidatus Babeliaceae bacterium]
MIYIQSGKELLPVITDWELAKKKISFIDAFFTGKLDFNTSEDNIHLVFSDFENINKTYLHAMQDTPSFLLELLKEASSAKNFVKKKIVKIPSVESACRVIQSTPDPEKIKKAHQEIAKKMLLIEKYFLQLTRLSIFINNEDIPANSEKELRTKLKNALYKQDIKGIKTLYNNPDFIKHQSLQEFLNDY